MTRPKIYTFELVTRHMEGYRARMSTAFSMSARRASVRVVEPRKLGFETQGDPRSTMSRQMFVSVYGDSDAYEASQFVRGAARYRGAMLHKGQEI